MAHSIRLWFETQGLLGSNPGRVGCLLSRLCIYTVLQTVQMSGVCSDIYGTVHYKESLKLLGYIPYFLSRYCHDYAVSNVKQYSLEITTRVYMTDIL